MNSLLSLFQFPVPSSFPSHSRLLPIRWPQKQERSQKKVGPILLHWVRVALNLVAISDSVRVFNIKAFLLGFQPIKLSPISTHMDDEILWEQWRKHIIGLSRKSECRLTDMRSHAFLYMRTHIQSNTHNKHMSIYMLRIHTYNNRPTHTSLALHARKWFEWSYSR